MPDTTQDLAAEIVDQQKRSIDWLKANYWPEWTQTYKNYKCEKDPVMDEEDPTQEDLTVTAVGMPDTYAMVRRQVARVTAQPPNIKFRADDQTIASHVSKTLMYQWDKGGIQKGQKKHVLQASIFGWSVRAWYWLNDERERKRRIDPLSQTLAEDQLKAIQDQYGVDPRMVPPEMMAQLIAAKGRGGLLPISYLYKCYEGPKADYLFIGDCYPEPNFTTIQSSNYFIVARRRNKEWLEKLAELYPEFQAGVMKLLDEFPDGSPRFGKAGNQSSLRTELIDAIGRSDNSAATRSDSGGGVKEWTVLERHKPGLKPKLAYVAENTVFLGEIDHPYDLEGKIPFTELVFIDDLLAGIGDSNARIARGLQMMHDRNTNQRSDLVDALARPYMGTDDADLYENPKALERGKGMRLILAKRQGSLWTVGEGPAQASVVASLNEDGSIGRQIQMLSGESNMSLQAGVDPQQARTATGARIMAYTGDILSKDQVDMFTYCLRDDLEMMYLLNRSELTAPVKFDGNQYNRQYIGAPAEAQQNAQPEMMTATPEDFQYDGEVEAEVGSTLAADDDMALSKAQSIFQSATQFPQLFNVERARNDLLIAMGKGRDLAAYLPAPQPPPPPPEPKVSANVSIRPELYPPEFQAKIFEYMGIEITPQDVAGMPQMPPPGMGQRPMGAPPPLPQQPPNPMGPEPMPTGASSFAASQNHSPFGPK